MASPFQRYQSGIEASTGNLVQAYGQMGQQTAAAIAGFGQNLAQGLQQYNENSAKNEILTAEAEQLGQQILQFKNQFGDSPEHAPFAQSLQPYIEQLAKVPSMSLTQKMGAVTGVKAAFANIGQQLQVFELMRGERMKRDINNARMGVREFDEQTVPTAIIPSGKMPYFYNKSYAENEAELVRLTNEAKAKGASVDLPTVLSNWRSGLKANAMSRTDLPPDVKERIVAQLDTAEKFDKNTLSQEDAAEFMMGGSQQSVKDQLAPPKVNTKTESKSKPDADTIANWSEKRKSAQDAIAFLSGDVASRVAYQDAVKNWEGLVEQDKKLYLERLTQWKTDQANLQKEFDQIPDKIRGLEEFQNSLPTKTKDKDGNEILNPEWLKAEKSIQALRKRRDEIRRRGTNLSGEAGLLDIPEPNSPLEADGTPKRPKPTPEQYRVAGDTTPNARLNIEAYKKTIAEADKNIGRLQRIENDKQELKRIDELIAKTQGIIDSDEAVAKGGVRQTAEGALKYLRQGGRWMFENAAMESARMWIDGEITPEKADEYIQRAMGDKLGMITSAVSATAGNIISQHAPHLDIVPKELTVKEKRNLQDALARYRTSDNIYAEELLKNPEGLITALKERKEQLTNSLATGLKAPTAAEISKAQQAAKPAEAKQEPSYTLTNQQNLSLGTTTMKVATSIDNKRKDMMGFFQRKYGYIPASFEESFKAIYPEANFKTMETPYGAFMYDGKEWKQIQVQQPKVMSNKEIAEEKAVTFGTPRADGSMDFQELAPRSGIYVRGIYAGSPSEASKFRTEMLETANARVAVNRLIEINDMVGESMPWNAKLWGEAKALLPQIKAGLRTDIIGVGTVSNYEQELINEVVAEPTKFWSLESSDRAKLAEIMRRVNNRLLDRPAMFGLEVRSAGQTNAEIERNLRLGKTGKSKLELDFEARGGKKGIGLNWNLTNKIPDALK